MEFTEEISKRIYDIIEDNDTNQQELAKAIDVNPKQISRWKTGQAEMGIYKLKKFCTYYGVSADYVLGLQKKKGYYKSSQE